MQGRNIIRFVLLALLVSVISGLGTPGGAFAALTDNDCGQCHTDIKYEYDAGGNDLNASARMSLHHAAGARLGITSCSACHDPAIPVLTCLTCHNNPQIDTDGFHLQAHTRISIATDCQACHSSLQIIETTHLDNCFGCHTSTDPLVVDTIASGIAGNPVDCNGCHSPHSFATAHDINETAGCDSCHDVLDNTKVGIEAVHNTDRNGAGSCATCHNSADTTTQTFITDNVANSLECSSCHAVHDFPSNHDISETAGCKSCHDELDNTKVGIEAVHNTDRNGAGSCATCHSSTDTTTQGFITDNVANSLECSSCHAVHDFPSNHDISETPGCNICHDVLDNTKVGIEAVHDTARNGAGSCATCHSSTDTTTQGFIDDNVANTLDCSSCHASGHGAQDHNMFVIEPWSCYNSGNCHTPGDFDGVVEMHRNECATCHSNSESRYVDVITAGKAGTQVDCATCHIGHHSEITNVPECESCHGFTSEYVSLTDNPVTNMHWTALLNMECNTCHTRGGPVAQDTIANLKVYETGSCANCHELVDHDLGASHDTVTATAGCADCHGDTSTFDAFLTIHDSATNGAGSCATCHESPRTEIVDLINDVRWHNTTRGVECADCHASHSFAGDHDISETGGCVSCHTDLDGTKVGIEAVHNTSRNGSGSCNTCHNSTDITTQGYINDTTSNSLTCASCHSTHDTATDHDMLGDSGCGSCHGVPGEFDPVTVSRMVEIHDIDNNGSCVTCHSSTSTYAISTIADGRAGTEVNCDSCHGILLSGNDLVRHQNYPSHSRIAISTYREDNHCIDCHNDPNASGFWEISEFHRKTVDGQVVAWRCSACHQSSRSTVVDIINNEASGLDSQLTVISCNLCHNENEESRHVPLDPPSQHDNLSSAQGCNAAGCHQGSFNYIETIHDVTTNGDGACATCHNSTDSTVVSTIAVGMGSILTPAQAVAVDCTNCHGAVDHVFADVHSITEPGWLSVTRKCSYCHGDLSAPAGIEAAHDLPINGDDSCSTCHNSSRQVVKDTIAAKAAVDCFVCHNEHGADVATVAPAHDKFADSANCTSCHDTDTIEERLMAHPKRITNPPTQSDCGMCHETFKTVVIATISSGRAGNTVDCQTCHSGEPSSAYVHGIDVEGAAPVHNNLRDSDTTCADCHDTGTAEARILLHPDCETCHLSTKSYVVNAIRIGKGFVGSKAISCEYCHIGPPDGAIDHGTDAAGAAAVHNNLSAPDTNCADCHATGSAEARIDLHPACTTCHSSTKSDVVAAINGGKGAAGASASCEDCHNGTANGAMEHGVTPATAAGLHNFFADSNTCTPCHTTDSAEKRLDAHPDCNTCHTSSVTEVVNAISDGKAGDTVSCETCHTNTAIGVTVHGLDAAGAADIHNNLAMPPANSCGDCHATGSAEARIGLHPECTTCHTSTKSDVTGVISGGMGAAGTPASCADCHTGTANGAIVHGLTSETAEASHDYFADSQTCTVCHMTDTAVKRLDTHLDCNTCHTSTNGAVVATITTGRGDALVSCENCHDDPGVLMHSLDPETLHNNFMGSTNCGQCHDIDTIVKRVEVHADCTTCHASTDTTVVNAINSAKGTSTTTVNCETCHGDFGHPDATHSNITNLGTVCYDCHGQDLTPPPVSQAVSIIHKDNCLVCHTSTRANVVASIADGKLGNMQNCLDCHTPAADPKVDPQDHHVPAHDNVFLPETICADCHVANVVLAHDSPNTVSCSTCHAEPYFLVPIINSARSSNPDAVSITCADCHSAINMTSHRNAHDKTVLPAAECVECHDANVAVEHLDNRALDCNVCHNSGRTDVKNAIANGQGPTGVEINCSDCHTGPLDHKAAHDMAVVNDPSCLDCHAGNVVTEHVDNRGYTCSRCHDDPLFTIEGGIIDQGMAGNTIYCTTCHTTSDHTNAHNMTTTSTTDTTCVSCHDNDVSIEHVTKRSLTCTVCHSSTDQTVVNAINSGKGLGGSTVECSACHTVHSFSSSHDISESDGCNSCHDALNGTETGIEAVHNTSRNGDGACATCHNSSDTTTQGYITDGAANVLQCSSCHVDHVAAHNILTVPECKNCHTVLNDTQVSVQAVHGNACTLCHESSRQEVIDAIAGNVSTGSSCDVDPNGSYIEAENYNVFGNNWEVRSDNASANGGSYLYALSNNTSSPPGTPAEYTLNFTETGTYYIWFRGNANSSSGDNSLWYGVDGGMVGNADFPYANSNWNWTNARYNTGPNPTTITINSTGSHTINIWARENGNRFDGFYITKSSGVISGAIPSGAAVIDPTDCATTGGAISCNTCHTPHNYNLDNHQISEADGCVVCHTTLNGTLASIETLHDVTTNGAGACNTCHNSGRSEVMAAISAGTPVDCTACHDPHSFNNHQISEATGCATCHTDLDGTLASIETMHDVTTNGAGSCATCHNSSRSIVVTTISAGIPVDCSACHSAHVFSDHQISETAGCSDCHTELNGNIQSVETLHDVATNGAGSCATCHSSSRSVVVSAIAARAPVECVDCHDPHGQADHDQLGTFVDCSSCHSSGSFDAIATLHLSDCATCHLSTSTNVIDAIADGRAGIAVDCTNCHGAIDHAASHNDTNVPDPTCEQCHDQNVFVEHAVVRNLSCDICHNPTYQDIINDGVANNITVTCANCHAPSHHDNDTARNGMCTDCHADPRPLVNDPQQLACRQCHIDNNGYVKTSSPSPSHSFNTLADIQDFGACFDCHAPIPWHAKPVSDPDCWTLPSNSPYYIPNQAPGRGTFNIFNQELRKPRKYYDNTSNESRAKDWCKDYENSFTNPQVNFYWFDIVYQGQTDSVPAFEPANAFPPYPHNMIKTDVGSNCGNCHTVGTVIGVTHNNECIRCHFSDVNDVENAISWGRAGNDVYCSNCHGTEGHDAQHDMTQLNQTSCSECHVDNVVTEHVDNRGLACSVCHDNSAYATVISNGKNGFTVTCFDCHGTADHLTLHAATNVDQTSCADCHEPNVVTEHLVNQGLDCVDCHDSIDPVVEDTIAGLNGSVTCRDCHGQDAGNHAAAHDQAGPSGGSNCTDCHDGNVVTEHITNRGLTCGTCHDNPVYSSQIAAGKAGTYQNCEACHGQNAGDHAAAHDNAGVPSAGCTSCHAANVVQEHVYDRGFTCSTCHDNSAYSTIINNGQNGTFVSCYDCHGQNSHHAGAEAQAGDCTFCHADARLDIEPNAPTGQLACVECHGSNQHNNGGPIQDFGACFACHSPAPYHAKPSSTPRDCNSGGPGQGSFNIFSSQFGGGGEHNRRNDNCEGRENDYRNPAISFSWVTIFDYFTTNQTWDVPTFGEGGGSGGGGGTQNDSVTITYARYDSRRDRVRVYAENSMGDNAQLTVHYDGDSYNMQWESSDDRWEEDISDSRCRDSTIEVTSSAGGSDTSSVSNCSSSGWGM